jgi:hypothetical protein
MNLSTTVPAAVRNQPPAHNSNERKITSEEKKRVSDDIIGQDSSTEDSSSSIYISDTDSSDDGRAKPNCPLSVTQVISALSAVGTLGGLALITSGGMGITLNKPIDNTMENIAMVLSGSALLVGSWVGSAIYANKAAT